VQTALNRRSQVLINAVHSTGRGNTI
jgi:hypothetical protein